MLTSGQFFFFRPERFFSYLTRSSRITVMVFCVILSVFLQNPSRLSIRSLAVPTAKSAVSSPSASISSANPRSFRLHSSNLLASSRNSSGVVGSFFGILEILWTKFVLRKSLPYKDLRHCDIHAVYTLCTNSVARDYAICIIPESLRRQGMERHDDGKQEHKTPHHARQFKCKKS